MMTGNPFLLFLVLWPMAGGALSYVAGRYSRGLRNFTACAVTLAELAAAVYAKNFLGTSLALDGICALGLNFTLDGFRLVYAVIIAFMWAATTLFSPEYLESHYNRNRYYLYVLLTLGAIMGVFLSADLYTTFVFFEIMSLVSYVMVIQDETPAALRAADTYMAIAIIGGLVTLVGLVLLHAKLGTLDIASLPAVVAALGDRAGLYLPGFLVFVGFAAKAAIFPAHIWLPTAHTAAPAPASALLSGLLTKSGLFGILTLSAGPFLHDERWGLMLLLLALITMVLGAVLALFSVNLKRTLACSSMSQLGFILTGVAMQCLLGVDNDLAVRGVLLYMVGHSLIKLVLFLCAGVVHMNTHKLELNDIRGFGRGKPLFLFAFLMGALGLMGMPLWNGYLGKTLIHESIVEHLHHLAHSGVGGGSIFLFQFTEWTFLLSGGLTTAYVLKLFVVLFISKPAHSLHQRDRYIGPINALVLTASALLLPLFGCLPYALADPLSALGSSFMNGPSAHHVVPYFSLSSLEGAMISLGAGTAVYLLFVRPFLTREEHDGEIACLDRWPAWLDIENLLFRPVLARLLPFLGALFARLVDLAVAGPVTFVLSHTAKRIRFVRPPEDMDFGLYLGSMGEQISVQRLLPSSMAFSLMSFVFGLLFVLAYLIL
ncbi:MAG: hypothetical protein IJU98_06195 [Synergistaceae bacterium]|nr:hypothetical protein [Synergistaceae bacterium]